MSNVRYLPNADMPAEVVLDGAKKAGLHCCVVIGFGDDGEYVASSRAAISDALWMIERAKHFLMKVAEQTEGF